MVQCVETAQMQGTLAERCPVELGNLYQAYTRLVAGAHKVRVRSADYREVEYGPGNLPELLKLYNYYFQMCGAASGLPDLAAASTASVHRRGPGARVGSV